MMIVRGGGLTVPPLFGSAVGTDCTSKGNASVGGTAVGGTEVGRIVMGCEVLVAGRVACCGTAVLAGRAQAAVTSNSTATIATGTLLMALFTALLLLSYASS